MHVMYYATVANVMSSTRNVAGDEGCSRESVATIAAILSFLWKAPVEITVPFLQLGMCKKNLHANAGEN